LKNSYSQAHPITKIGITTFVILLCFLVFFIVAAVVAIPLFGLDSFSSIVNSTMSMDESNIPFLKYIQVVQSIGLFIIPSLVLAVLFGGNISKYLKINKIPHVTSAAIAIAIILVSSPMINMLAEVNSKLALPEFLSGIENWMRTSEDSANEITQLFLKADSVWVLLFNIFMIGIIPALGEEFLFRGVIQRIFTDWTKNYHWGIWISAILFSALHLQFYGFIPRVILGAIFGYMLVWSGSLWFPIIAHFVNNTTAVIAYYLYNGGAISVDPDKIGTGSEYQIAGIISSILVFVLFWHFYKVERNIFVKTETEMKQSSADNNCKPVS